MVPPTLPLLGRKSCRGLIHAFTYLDTKLREEGLYRKCGKKDLVEQLGAVLRQGDLSLQDLLDFTEQDDDIQDEEFTHVVTGAVKKVLREHQPLIPYEVFAAWIEGKDARRQSTHHDKRAIRILLRSLPAHAVEVLKALMSHLARVVECEADNRMSLSALSTVMAMSVARRSESTDDMLEDIGEGGACAELFQKLVQHAASRLDRERTITSGGQTLQGEQDGKEEGEDEEDEQEEKREEREEGGHKKGKHTSGDERGMAHSPPAGDDGHGSLERGRHDGGAPRRSKSPRRRRQDEDRQEERAERERSNSPAARKRGRQPHRGREGGGGGGEGEQDAFHSRKGLAADDDFAAGDDWTCTEGTDGQEKGAAGAKIKQTMKGIMATMRFANNKTAREEPEGPTDGLSSIGGRMSRRGRSQSPSASPSRLRMFASASPEGRHPDDHEGKAKGWARVTGLMKGGTLAEGRVDAMAGGGAAAAGAAAAGAAARGGGGRKSRSPSPFRALVRRQQQRAEHPEELQAPLDPRAKQEEDSNAKAAAAAAATVRKAAEKASKAKLATLRAELKEATAALRVEREARERERGVHAVAERLWGREMEALRRSRGAAEDDIQRLEGEAGQREREAGQVLSELESTKRASRGMDAVCQAARSRAEREVQGVLVVQERMLRVLQEEAVATARASAAREEELKQIKAHQRAYLQDFFLWRDRALRYEAQLKELGHTPVPWAGEEAAAAAAATATTATAATAAAAAAALGDTAAAALENAEKQRALAEDEAERGAHQHTLHLLGEHKREEEKLSAAFDATLQAKVVQVSSSSFSSSSKEEERSLSGCTLEPERGSAAAPALSGGGKAATTSSVAEATWTAGAAAAAAAAAAVGDTATHTAKLQDNMHKHPGQYHHRHGRPMSDICLETALFAKQDIMARLDRELQRQSRGEVGGMAMATTFKTFASSAELSRSLGATHSHAQWAAGLTSNMRTQSLFSSPLSWDSTAASPPGLGSHRPGGPSLERNPSLKLGYNYYGGSRAAAGAAAAALAAAAAAAGGPAGDRIPKACALGVGRSSSSSVSTGKGRVDSACWGTPLVPGERTRTPA